MRIVSSPITSFTVLALLASCTEPTDLRDSRRPSFTTSALTSQCPPHADFIATDQSSLLAALSGAQAGDTIALDGMIDVTIPQIDLDTDGILLTCVTPGSGLRVGGGANVDYLVSVGAKDVSVEHLALDAHGANWGAYVAFNLTLLGLTTPAAERERFVDNDVQCGAGIAAGCVEVDNEGVAGAVLSDNRIISDEGSAGIQFQGVVGGVVARNTVVTTIPAFAGAIHIDGGTRNSVTTNVVKGPWFSALGLDDLNSATVARGNQIDGTAGNTIELFTAQDDTLTDNVVQCSDFCVIADASPRLVVSGNQFTAAGASSGVHVEDGSDGSRIVGNTIVATAPSAVPVFGGIRARDGAGLVITGNTVVGPWINGIAVTDISASIIEGNQLQGAGQFDLWLGAGTSFLPVGVTGGRIARNRAGGAGGAGLFVSNACSNTFMGNDLQGNAGEVGAAFDVMTGANSLAGNGTIVADDGRFDCDGNGTIDPNVITGQGPVRHGLVFGPPSGVAIVNKRGIIVR